MGYRAEKIQSALQNSFTDPLLRRNKRIFRFFTKTANVNDPSFLSAFSSDLALEHCFVRAIDVASEIPSAIRMAKAMETIAFYYADFCGDSPDQSILENIRIVLNEIPGCRPSKVNAMVNIAQSFAPLDSDFGFDLFNDSLSLVG